MSDPALLPEQRKPPNLLASVAVLIAYALILISAVVLLRTRQAMPAGSELSVPRTVFTVANAASLTGFQQTISVESYKPLGQGVILALIVAGSLLSMIVGGAAVVRLLRLPYSMAAIALSGLIVEAIAIGLGTAALFGSERNAFQAVFQAASAFGNCGVIVGAATGKHHPLVPLAILPLAVLGGLGLPVLMELFDGARRRRPLSTHARVVLAMTAGVYLVGGALLAWMRFDEHVRGAIVAASTDALNVRTLGWTIESPAYWPRAAVWIVMLLMLIGASPAGTGGGIKTTTLFVLSRGTNRALRGRAVCRTFGVASLWLVVYLLVAGVTLMRLLGSEAQLPADQILFISFSAVSSVGIAYAPISITGDGLYTLSVSMMLGRLLPLVILWWTALTVRDADVAVG